MSDFPASQPDSNMDGNAFQTNIRKINPDDHAFQTDIQEINPDDHAFQTNIHMEASAQMIKASRLEKRYETENQLLAIVARGQIHKLNQLLEEACQFFLCNPETADSLRNQKNQLIIFNTLLRKAAENGGVHPIYINDVAEDFLSKTESMQNAADAPALFRVMMRKYCLLVHNRSMKNYSRLVQKTIILIDSDLTADLSLSSMASILNINASYLSSHFHKETGQTLTSYVNKRRIDYAIMLLNTTNLQVQTIAQYCGISDINYFTRIFKKIIGMTPSQYRETIR